MLLASGCFLPHPEEPETPAAVKGSPAASKPGSVQVSTGPIAAVSAAEAAAIAAAMQQVKHTKTDYRLAPADLISVTVYQNPDMDRKVRVNTDGTVSLPLIGSINIGGMTLLGAQAAVETNLAKFLVSPQVSLFIEEYGNKTVYVMGEVQKPGSYPIPTESRMTLLEAISTASGFTPVAAQDRVRVLRYVNGASVSYTVNTKEITRQGQKEKDMVLEPNDIIYVPQSFF
jgi:polysaccharide export outer membrane protein